ncbi:MAG: lipid-A-disaccharide synthase [Planctomycetia bacterium]|nr:lipid-A-disaccharide synthase [Planctomycetia bacterium]
MRIFISAGEPSGDLHGSNLAMALRQANPLAEIDGFGGPRLQAAGQQQLYPLAEHAVMGFVRVIVALPQFYRFLNQAIAHFEQHRPDALVLIDYPGFHWHLAKAAHQRGIPVYWFVPPQIWAWATHRVKRMRKWVDHVFCNLPFETEWYRSRGVNCTFIGHPYFDALSQQTLDESFLKQQNQAGRRIAILPGSRTHEVHDNVPMMLRAAQYVHEAIPDARFLVAGFKSKQAEWIKEQVKQYPKLNIEVHVGRTPEIIHWAEVCMAVSGSVSLELLNATLPTVTVYKTGPFWLKLAKIFKHAKYISLINLLAEKELSPEYLTAQDDSKKIADHLIGWLQSEASRNQVRDQMQQVKGKIANTGACERAVQYLLATLPTKRQAA